MDSMFSISKISQPPLNKAGYVSRPRLLHSLDDVLSIRLGIVCAPIGFGKTSLCSEWVSSLALTSPTCKTAWLRLDSDDNDMLSLMLGILHAVSPVIEDSESLHASLLAVPRSGMRSFVIDLSNALSKCLGDDADLVLVLDDFQSILDRNALEAFDLLLDNAPPHVHFLVISDTQLDQRFVRFRVRSQLVSISGNSMALYLEEVGQLLGIDIEALDDNLKDLHKRFGGWAAAWHLVAVAMENRGEATVQLPVANSIDSLAGYVAEDIISSCGDRVASFIRTTARFPRICASLCNAIMGFKDSADIIRHLSASGLLFRVDGKSHRWYSYYPAFIEPLLAQAETSHCTDCIIRAAHWYVENNMPLEAISAAISSDDLDLVASLIERFYRIVIMHGIPEYIGAYLSSLPEDELSRYPWLELMLAWTANQRVDLRAMRYHIERTVDAASSLDPETRMLLQRDCAVMNAIFESHHGNP